MDFESASKELEQIVAKLEKGVALEEGLKLFERGKELTKFCYDKLDEVSGKITFIKSELNGIIEEELK